MQATTRSWRGPCSGPLSWFGVTTRGDMANYPKKMKDPTEAALSAIQDALNIRDADTPAPPISVDLDNPEPRRRAKRGPVEDDFFVEPAPIAREEEPAPRRAANDDQQSIGQILQAVQRRPARTSY